MQIVTWLRCCDIVNMSSSRALRDQKREELKAQASSKVEEAEQKAKEMEGKVKSSFDESWQRLYAA